MIAASAPLNGPPESLIVEAPSCVCVEPPAKAPAAAPPMEGGGKRGEAVAS
jgi:hypothetical protein